MRPSRILVKWSLPCYHAGMNKDHLTPQSRQAQISKTSLAVKNKHKDPVWHAAWLEGVRAYHKRRKELVDRALEALKSQESHTS